MYRVRTRTPDHNYSYPPILDSVRKTDTLYIGDLCAFKSGYTFKLGRIIQFSYLNGRTPNERGYTSNYAFVASNNNQKSIGALCNWFYQKEQSPEQYVSFGPTKQVTHTYESIEPFLCTIPEVFITIVNSEILISKALYEHKYVK